jgi:hypothetical protein
MQVVVEVVLKHILLDLVDLVVEETVLSIQTALPQFLELMV